MLGVCSSELKVIDLKVVVVGSGLSAVGAITAAVRLGLKPLVLDVGERLPDSKELAKHRLSSKLPSLWQPQEVSALLGDYPKFPSAKFIPRKSLMGSHYMYRSLEQSGNAKNPEFAAPYSFALGGFSQSWGAAYSIPQAEDISEWPILREDLLLSIRDVLTGLSVSEHPSAHHRFPNLASRSNPIPLTSSQEFLLRKLERVSECLSDGVAMPARLLTDARRCHNCGYCGSGCVYDAIFRAEVRVNEMRSAGVIDYRADREVVLIEERSNSVHIVCRNVKTQDLERLVADRVFLATGCVSSSKILMSSSCMGDARVTVKRSGGFIRLYLVKERLESHWPEMNTQSALTLGFVHRNRWAHQQIAQANDLLMSYLRVPGRDTTRKGRLSLASKFVAEQLVFVLSQLHSDFGSRYELRLDKVNDFEYDVFSEYVIPTDSERVNSEIDKTIKKALRQEKLLSVPGLKFDSMRSAGYHLGCSFPMTSVVKSWNETDLLGRPFGWERTHVVDSSILPSVPGTGIGLLSMAIAYLITTRAFG